MSRLILWHLKRHSGTLCVTSLGPWRLTLPAMGRGGREMTTGTSSSTSGSRNTSTIDNGTATVVKAQDIGHWPDRSELSGGDLIMPKVRGWVQFLYAYNVPHEDVERAMEKALSRYGELAGRLVVPVGRATPYVEMNNAGALLLCPPKNNVTLEDIRATGYDTDFLLHHGICVADPGDLDAYPIKVRTQYLACGGLSLAVGFHHTICDIDSLYFFAADLAHLIKSSCQSFRFSASEMMLHRRTQIFPAKNDCQILEHPDFSVYKAEEGRQIMKLLDQHISKRPEKVIKLHISWEQLKNLKREILAEYKGNLHVSGNDCLLSVLLHAYMHSSILSGGGAGGTGTRVQEESSTEADAEPFYFQFVCNTRYRLEEPIISKKFFGNAIYPLRLKKDHSSWKATSVTESACEIRESVVAVDGKLIDSAMRFIQDNNDESTVITQPVEYFWRGFFVSNWNNAYDWYSGLDLGAGPPEKMLVPKLAPEGMAFVLPHPTDGLEIHTSCKKEAYEDFIAFPFLAKYFKIV